MFYYSQTQPQIQYIYRIAGGYIKAEMEALDKGDGVRNSGECPHFLSTLLKAEQLTQDQITGITTDLFTAGIDSVKCCLFEYEII